MLAAEETGTLDTTLEQLAASLEAEVALRQQISAGTRYPMIVADRRAARGHFVMIFVVPQFQEIFRSLGAKLPLMTQIVLDIAPGAEAASGSWSRRSFIGYPLAGDADQLVARRQR